MGARRAENRCLSNSKHRPFQPFLLLFLKWLQLWRCTDWFLHTERPGAQQTAFPKLFAPQDGRLEMQMCALKKWKGKKKMFPCHQRIMWRRHKPKQGGILTRKGWCWKYFLVVRVMDVCGFILNPVTQVLTLCSYFKPFFADICRSHRPLRPAEVANPPSTTWGQFKTFDAPKNTSPHFVCSFQKSLTLVGFYKAFALGVVVHNGQTVSYGFRGVYLPSCWPKSPMLPCV